MCLLQTQGSHICRIAQAEIYFQTTDNNFDLKVSVALLKRLYILEFSGRLSFPLLVFKNNDFILTFSGNTLTASIMCLSDDFHVNLVFYHRKRVI